MSSETHFTTRRSFIAAMGFGGVGLYGLWAAYGAAPGPLALLGIGGEHGDMASVAEPGGEGGHGGHGAGAGGPTPEEFKRMVTDFVERYSLPDGTVHPRPLASPTALLSAADSHEVTDHGQHGDHGMLDHAASEAPADIHDGHGDSAAHAEEGERLDVLVSAGKWYYLPDKLRLDAGRPYRFRMMALDVSHGASIQFGNGGRMVRLRPGRLTDMDITFEKPGRYLIHCTVYCGAAHDLMQATIEVA